MELDLKRIAILGGKAVGALIVFFAVLTILFAPIEIGAKIGFLALVLIPAGIAYVPRLLPNAMMTLSVLLSIVVVILIDAGGWLTAAGAVLNLLINPYIDPKTVVQCKDSPACSVIQPIVYSAVLLAVVVTGFAYATLLERKVVAWFQHRTGPNRVGPWGLLQPAADGIKLIFKEDILPAGADKWVYWAAPILKAAPTLIVLAVIPLGPDVMIPWFNNHWYQVPLHLADPSVGLLWILAITSLGTYGVTLAGWASNNKYSMLGGLRATAQMISYELSLGTAMAVPVILAGSLSVGDIINAQNGTPIISWFVFQNPLAAAILIVALIAEVNRSPFDLPEAEQELTAGFMTEYSGMKFAMFMMGEYLGMIAVSLVAMSMFFGGYHFILVDQIPILGPVVVLVKVALCLVGFVWIRATLPRIRYDRLMSLGWKVMLPLALVAVMWSAIAVVIGQVSSTGYVVISAVFAIVVVVGGFYLVNRAGRLQTDEEDALEDDPIITGEQRGIGVALLQIVGSILGLLFAGYDATVWMLQRLAKLGEKPTAIVPTEDQPRTPAKSSGGD